jgi:hypothetical protein
MSQILVTTAAAEAPGDARRASQALIDSIKCLEHGQTPTAVKEY